MARLIKKVITARRGNIHFDVRLREPVTAVLGNSGSGKTQLTAALLARQAGGSGESEQYAFIDWKLNENAAKVLVSLQHGKVIFIDNADIVLRDVPYWRKQFEDDNSNQYIIFTRMPEKYGIHETGICEFIRQGSGKNITVSARYFD
ncbi:MAG: hypothetical protein Q4F29_09485 [Lachnospiraceae bacterium]|nr:hypothetical protein [Lachnospiraceae bacterium]